jgi:hypothetical protein
MMMRVAGVTAHRGLPGAGGTVPVMLVRMIVITGVIVIMSV